MILSGFLFWMGLCLCYHIYLFTSHTSFLYYTLKKVLKRPATHLATAGLEALQGVVRLWTCGVGSHLFPHSNISTVTQQGLLIWFKSMLTYLTALSLYRTVHVSSFNSGLESRIIWWEHMYNKTIYKLRIFLESWFRLLLDWYWSKFSRRIRCWLILMLS